MINMLRPAAALCAALSTAVFALVAPAFSQAPTDAQRSAGAVREDFLYQHYIPGREFSVFYHRDPLSSVRTVACGIS